jgi:trehalose-6-phosphatase
MIRHMVMFRKKPDTDEATIHEIMERLEGLYGEIHGLMGLWCYRSMPSDRPVMWTFLLDSKLADLDALQRYLSHPKHVEVNEWMSPFLESRAVVDYEE